MFALHALLEYPLCACPGQHAASACLLCKHQSSGGAAKSATLPSQRHWHCLPAYAMQYNDLGYAVHMYDFHGPLLLPKTYDTLAQTLFAPGSQHSIYMERLQSCSQR